MKIRFFGDSWYWSWYPTHLIQSQLLKNRLKNRGGYPAMEVYLNNLGIDCVTHNRPGSDFENTVKSIVKTTDHTDIKYNVVFFSSHIRNYDYENVFNMNNYKEFIEKFNNLTVSMLSTIQKWAEENNQEVFLVGGHSTLHKEIFDRVENKKNLHLLSECIVSQFVSKERPYGIFKKADFTKEANKNWDPDLINHLYNDIKEWEDQRQGIYNVTWPDDAHLNNTGALLLTDLILCKIEELEENNEKT